MECLRNKAIFGENTVKEKWIKSAAVEREQFLGESVWFFKKKFLFSKPLGSRHIGFSVLESEFPGIRGRCCGSWNPKLLFKVKNCFQLMWRFISIKNFWRLCVCIKNSLTPWPDSDFFMAMITTPVLLKFGAEDNWFYNEKEYPHLHLLPCGLSYPLSSQGGFNKAPVVLVLTGPRSSKLPIHIGKWFYLYGMTWG